MWPNLRSVRVSYMCKRLYSNISSKARNNSKPVVHCLTIGLTHTVLQQTWSSDLKQKHSTVHQVTYSSIRIPSFQVVLLKASLLSGLICNTRRFHLNSQLCAVQCILNVVKVSLKIKPPGGANDCKKNVTIFRLLCYVLPPFHLNSLCFSQEINAFEHFFDRFYNHGSCYTSWK